MTHHRSYQIRYTDESRCPRQKWIPAFAGKARRGRRAASTERICALGCSQTAALGPSWLFLQRNNSHRFALLLVVPPRRSSAFSLEPIRHEHYGNFSVAHIATDVLPRHEKMICCASLSQFSGWPQQRGNGTA